MKRLFICLVLGLALILSGGMAMGHTTVGNGGDGFKDASLPPKGFYFKYYNYFYQAQQYNNGGWGQNKYMKYHYATDVNMFRFMWSTGQQFLGGELFADFIVPFSYQYVYKGEELGYRDRFDVGDVHVDLLNAWHGSWYDAYAGLKVILPTGTYSSSPNFVSTGSNFWTLSPVVGATLFFDDAKTWAATFCAYYEFHTVQQDTQWLPGQSFHVNWSFGKSINDYFSLALSGFCYWDTTPWSGKGVKETDVYNRIGAAYGAGPEIGVNIPEVGLFFQLRHEWEFAVANRPQGTATVFTVTYAF
ncbi:MAG: transporter [Desulfovibrio sp.]|nr:transporter [Desulfovibrio sp.]